VGWTIRLEVFGLVGFFLCSGVFWGLLCVFLGCVACGRFYMPDRFRFCFDSGGVRLSWLWDVVAGLSRFVREQERPTMVDWGSGWNSVSGVPSGLESRGLFEL